MFKAASQKTATTADRRRRRGLVGTSVTANTPVTEPGPVLPYPINPSRLPALERREESARRAPELEVADARA